MTDEELKQAINELNDNKVEEFTAVYEAYGRKQAEEDLILMREEMQQEERDAELRVCVKEFFEKYLNRTEESSGGKMFNPIVVSCCRVMMQEPLNNLLARMAELSGATPREKIYDLQGE